MKAVYMPVGVLRNWVENELSEDLSGCLTEKITNRIIENLEDSGWVFEMDAEKFDKDLDIKAEGQGKIWKKKHGFA